LDLKSEQPKATKIPRITSENFEEDLKNQIDDLFITKADDDPNELATYEN